MFYLPLSGENSPRASPINEKYHRDVEADEEGTCDLPPPIQPIQDSQSMVANIPTNLTAVEQHESSKSKFLKPHDAENESGDGDDNLIENDVEMSLKQRMYVLRELVATEESYVQDLSLIVDGYIREMKDPESDIPLPDDLKGGKERMIFGNIEAIYEWHRDTFLKLLKRCIECPTDIEPIIQKSKPKLGILYVIYCKNKPVSEHIVTEHLGYFDEVGLKLKHTLVFSDLLIKPVQRIMKYELLLSNYLKHTERAGLFNEIPSIQEAINVIKEVTKEANDMMDVGRLQNFEGKITAQGKLLLHGPLLCTEVDTNNLCIVYKPKELQVFLFEQNIILSEIVGKKTQFTNPAYIYKTHIQINKMKIRKLSNNRFLLRSTDEQRQGLSLVLTTQTQEQYREWVDKITNILQTQNDFLEALLRPIEYQNKLNKESSSYYSPANHRKQIANTTGRVTSDPINKSQPNVPKVRSSSHH